MPNKKISELPIITTVSDDDEFEIRDIDVSEALQNKRVTVTQLKAVFGIEAGDDLSFQGDTGGALTVNLTSQTLSLNGGDGISTAGSGQSVTFNHSSVGASDINGSGNNFLQDITMDAWGHVTAVSAAAWNPDDLAVQGDTGPLLSIILASETLTFTGGTGLASVGSGDDITFNHSNSGLTTSINGSGNSFLQDITVDDEGHVTAVSAAAWTPDNLAVQGDLGSAISIILASETLTMTGGTGITSTSSGNDVTFNHTNSITAATISGDVINSITYDTEGHITAVGTSDTLDSYATGGTFANGTIAITGTGDNWSNFNITGVTLQEVTDGGNTTTNAIESSSYIQSNGVFRLSAAEYYQINVASQEWYVGSTRVLRLNSSGLTIDTGALFLDSNNHITISSGQIDFDITASTNILRLNSTGATVTGAVIASSYVESTNDGVFRSNSTNKMQFANNLYVDFTINNSFNMRLEADGDLHIRQDLIQRSTTVTSDERTKIINKDPYEDFDRTKLFDGDVAIRYKRKDDNYESSGVSAQRLQKIMPWAVKETNSPFAKYKNELGVDHNALFFPIIDEIGDIRSRLEKLENGNN